MLHFFRKIRHDLIANSKFYKYFKYAIGEVVLVVVGILIALQINNWNEQRKIQAQEFEILKAIKSDLLNCHSEIAGVIKSNKNLHKHLSSIVKYIDEDLAYNTELDTAFARISSWPSPFFSYSAYETLKNKGVDLIQNKAIRENIISTYDFGLTYLYKDLDKYAWSYAESVSIPLVNKLIRRNLTNRLARPNDFEQLKENEEFLNMLYFRINFINASLEAYSHFGNSVNTLINDIENELSSRK